MAIFHLSCDFEEVILKLNNKSTTMNDRVDVAIVGAGLAGLSAAIHLHRAGKSVKIYEAKDYIGGRVSTLVQEGFSLDRGFHVLLTAYPECQKLLDYEKLNLKSFDNDALNIFREGKIERFSCPLKHPLFVFKLISSSFFTTKDFFNLLFLKRKLSKTSAESLLSLENGNALACLKKDGFSQKFIDNFFKPFLGGLLLDRNLLSSGKMVNFFLKMFFEGQAALPSMGMGALSEQMAAYLPEGTIHLNQEVQGINKEGLILNNNEKIKAKFVLLATDARSAAKLLDLPLPPIGHSVACCYYAAEKSPLNAPILFLNGEDKGPVNHLAVLSDVAPSYAPAGASLISATILDKYMHMSDEELNIAAMKQLSSWFGSQVSKWKLLKIFRILNAHPAIYPDRFWHSPYPFKVRDSLYACGDYLEAPNINSALAIGRKAAAEIIQA